jgi:hypothetical protein
LLSESIPSWSREVALLSNAHRSARNAVWVLAVTSRAHVDGRDSAEKPRAEAAPSWPPASIGDVHFALLVATGTDAVSIEQAGEDAVAAMALDVTGLNTFAWDLLTDAEHLASTKTTALRAVEAMARIDGWDTPSHMDTAALALFENGDVDGAIDLQQRAVAALGRPDPHYEQRLARYQQAKNGSPGNR